MTPNGFTYQWNLSVEHQFWKGIALTASYAGLRGQNLPISRPINRAAGQRCVAGSCRSELFLGRLASCFLTQCSSQSLLPDDHARDC